jgi:hypothetical protein
MVGGTVGRSSGLSVGAALSAGEQDALWAHGAAVGPGVGPLVGDDVGGSEGRGVG